MFNIFTKFDTFVVFIRHRTLSYPAACGAINQRGHCIGCIRLH